MIQQIEEVRIEPETRPLIELERLADTKIHVGKMRSRNGTATQVGVAPKTSVGIDRRIVLTISRHSKLAGIQILISSRSPCWVLSINDGPEHAVRTLEFR